MAWPGQRIARQTPSSIGPMNPPDTHRVASYGVLCEALTMATTTPAKSRKKTPMSEDHKAALAKGREEGRIVRRYLEALESTKPRRGRKRTPESIRKRLFAIDSSLGTADPLSRLHLIEERQRLEAELSHTGDTVDL